MQEIPGGALSYISPIGYANSTKCGYCGRRGKSFSYYATANSLNPALYQTLLGRSWRRSGNLLYRPNPRDSCCPHYTIRLDSDAFKPGRDQRQAVNRFNKFVLGEAYIKEAARSFPLSREQSRRRDTVFDLVERIHESEAEVLKTPLSPEHKLVVTLEDDGFTDEKYAVYENYQRIIHQEAPEEITKIGFKRFLCSSPLQSDRVILPDGREKLLGSYHQCYRIDGKLVAIGVLDLLPECVSAVYFLYHEDIHKHSPGKLGALREIALAREFDYKWWYPGFYIHSCPKMRYKVDFTPQFILDPEKLVWDPLDKEVLELLDKKPYLSLSRERERGADEENEQDATPDGHATMERPMSLFAVNMPGVTPFSEIQTVNMDSMLIKLGHSDGLYVASDLVIWDRGPLTANEGGLKEGIAELVAAMGADLMNQLVLDFSRH